MTEEIIIDGGRIAGITTLKNEIIRLEQENKELKEENITAQKEYWKLEQGNDFLAEKVRLYRSALEEIRDIADRLWSNKYQSVEEAENDVYFIQNKINEVLK